MIKKIVAFGSIPLISALLLFIDQNPLDLGAFRIERVDGKFDLIYNTSETKDVESTPVKDNSDDPEESITEERDKTSQTVKNIKPKKKLIEEVDDLDTDPTPVPTPTPTEEVPAEEEEEQEPGEEVEEPVDEDNEEEYPNEEKEIDDEVDEDESDEENNYYSNEEKDRGKDKDKDKDWTAIVISLLETL